MRQAIRLYGHELINGDRPFEAYRCSECSVRFDVEVTIAGPWCCPACGAIYTQSSELQAEQLARCAVALGMDTTTLLWILQAIIAGIRGGGVR